MDKTQIKHQYFPVLKTGIEPQTENIFENDFASIVIKSVQQFIDEEFRMYAYTDLRLIKKIEAARLLFAKEHKELSIIYKKMAGPDGRGL